MARSAREYTAESEEHEMGLSNQAYADCTDLIIVCCHAICEDASHATEESNWRLQRFQRSDDYKRKPGEHNTFILHIIAAMLSSATKAAPLIVFSGGRTTNSTLSEAESYQKVFKSLNVSINGRSLAECRTAIEDLATDSYQNLLFSILKFRKLVGRYPFMVTVVTHAFKEHRFQLHAIAMKWELYRLRIQGINPPFTNGELQLTERNEREHARDPFADDPYGVRPPLSDKRIARNWDPQVLEGLALDEGVDELLQWTGGESGSEWFPGKLPWDLMRAG